ncbi:MAG: glycosyltransferase [Phaeodactylibacter sp.]|nr:glycosyltransferase [Phaeodactylibacter sp.]MCB9304746.1 glycosyltransferase [Lewinellaceae bacterium]
MLNDKFKISVIIPTYNRRQLLEYTLRSLANQNISKAEFEVIVVDDGSSDDTFQMVKTFENIINLKYAYRIDKGYRPGSARNLGIRLAEGAICVFVDSGIILKNDCIQHHIDVHEKYPEELAVIGYVYGYSIESENDLKTPIDPMEADKSIASLVEDGAVWDMREDIYRKYNDKIEGLIVPWTLFWSCHISVSTRSLFEVGLFDENYDGNWGTEDNDLGYRLHQAGKKITLCREAAVLHLPHEVDLDGRIRDGAKNSKYFHEKYQTPITQLYFDNYVRDLIGQCANNEVIDFHELITKANI